MRNASSVFVVVAFALLAPFVSAQEQLWINQFGTEETDWATKMASDGAGGGFVTGYTYGSLAGPYLGARDAYLIRFDGSGSKVWERQIGTENRDEGMSVASDGSGGVFIAGVTQGDLGSVHAGRFDIFLGRYNKSGEQLWIRQFGTAASEVPFAVLADGVGGVMLAGWTDGEMNGSNAGKRDVILARYDRDGNQIWVQQFGTSEDDYGMTLASDGVGGVLLAGDTWGSYVAAYIPHNSDVFVARYDGDGNQLWIRQFGSASMVSVHSSVPDGSGGVIIGGEAAGSVGGPSAGHFDAFIARYDGEGNQVWIRKFGTSEQDTIRGLSVDGTGGFLAAGYTAGDLGGPSAGESDAFLAAFGGNGQLHWVHQFGSNDFDVATDLVPDGNGGAILYGMTYGDLTQPVAGRVDLFLARYSIDWCYADCDQTTGVGVLDVFDFLCFQNSFVNSEPYACDCDTSTGPGVCDVFDFLCFQNAFVAGCS